MATVRRYGSVRGAELDLTGAGGWPEGVYEYHRWGRRFAAKLDVRPGSGLLRAHAMGTESEAVAVIRRAKLRALLGGASDRLGTEAVGWAVVKAACQPGSKGVAGLRKAAAAALRIRLDARGRVAPVFFGTLPMSWGDVWASASGVCAFGAAVEAVVDPSTREVRPGAVVRVSDAVRVGLWDSPVGQTLKRRPGQLRVVPVGTVEVDASFLTAGVALDWAVMRLVRDARRLSEVLSDCGTADDLAAALGCNPVSDEDKATAGHDATVEQLWKMYSDGREEAEAAAMTAHGKLDWSKAPCVGLLINGTLPESRTLRHDLRFGLAVVLEETARRLGGHARSMFPLATLGALCTLTKPESRRSFSATLQSMARKTPGPLSKCTVIASRTARGLPGFKCQATSCDACHRAVGIPRTVPPEDVTPGMVASYAPE